jgi:hypothetical protein
MAIIPATVLFPKKFGLGKDFASRKDTTLAFDSDAFLAGGLTFDLIMEESHLWKNDVTSHAVEDGSTITDHIRNVPREGKMVGLISDYSLGAFALDNLDSRSQKAYTLLKEIWEKRELIDIVLTLEVYKNVAITDVRTKKDGNTGAALKFEISFKEVQVKKLETRSTETKINVGEMDSLIAKQAAQQKEIGRQVADFKSASLGFSVIPPI